MSRKAILRTQHRRPASKVVTRDPLSTHDFSFGILPSSLHWLWFTTKCSKLTARFRYTPECVFDTFPWPRFETGSAPGSCAADGAPTVGTASQKHRPASSFHETPAAPKSCREGAATDTRGACAPRTSPPSAALAPSALAKINALAEAGREVRRVCAEALKNLKTGLRALHRTLGASTTQVTARSNLFIRPALLCILVTLVPEERVHAAEQKRINLAPFGQTSVMESGASAARLRPLNVYPAELSAGQALQVEWTNPRDVSAVVLECAGPAPAAEELAVSWWRRIWPDNGTGGWMKLDDPFNGQWTRANVVARPGGPSVLRLDFAPLDDQEAPGVKRTGFRYRHTYKLRVSSARPIKVSRFSVLSDAVERRARLRFEWNLIPTVPGGASPSFEARNGRVLKTIRTGRNAAIVEVFYADCTNRLSADRGFIVCRNEGLRSFSVFVDDVLREGGLFVRDIGAFVSDADRNVAFAQWPGPRGEVWPEGTVVQQVARRPEQSLEEVMRAIPRKAVPYMFLGAPNLRQEFALGAKGEIRLFADSLRSPGPDAERRPWTWKELTYQFTSGESPGWWKDDRRTVQRTLEEGWLPVADHDWKEGDLAYRQSSVAAPLLVDLARLDSQTGTEPLVLVNRIRIQNPGSERRSATLWLALNHPTTLRLEADGLLRLDRPSDGTNRPGLTPVRGRWQAFGKGQLTLIKSNQALRYTVDLGPGESHAIELALAYIELLDTRELAALKSISFDSVRDSAVRFWKTRVRQGMTYEVPEPILNQFFKANLWHVLISTDIDPVTGHHQHGAATHHYQNYLNETMMVARSLEMRGEHEAARKLIEPFLDCQGVKGLPGNFKTQDGVLYAAHPTEPDPYTAQGYNMHHGWGLWATAEHFEWTHDPAWLRSIASKLVQGCDWITRERQATKFRNPDGSRPLEYGLAPAGDLEDVEEYLYFYATDAYYHLGMQQTAAALARIGHPQARRLARDAEEFRRDIQASVAESVATSPVVRLRDGTWVPFVPPRAYALTHLKEGWIREGLYPALHLLDGEVYPDDHPYADWMIEDLEDNIFMSQESGYGVEAPRANFFNLGGFTLQPNLPNLPLAYLRRDQVPNSLRGFYNTFWASLYPETMCFAEWVPAFGRGGGPLFKTPDECKFIQWMRTLLVMERGTALELGLGVPRAWMKDGQRVRLERAATFFGPLDLEILSRAGTGRMEAAVRLLESSPPKTITLRLRHPEGKPIRSATVNGRPAKVDQRRQLIDLPVNASAWTIAAEF